MNLKDARQGGVCIWTEPRHAAGVAAGLGGLRNVTMELCCGSVCTRILAVYPVISVTHVCYYRLGHGGCSA